jgi:predicted metal-dependent HD superfamily phosphohydrolase
VRALRKQWDECFENLALRAPEGAFESLVERYSESHRAYHTLQHIGECFAQFEHVHDARSPGEVGLALWFHDAIYDPRASDNEARSARWAHAVLIESGATTAVIEAVDRLVLATQHDAMPQEHDAKIVVDIDLSILGADESRYREYEVQIRREYEWVEEDAFRRGRIKVLQSFLNRPFIYSTDHFRALLETVARRNLKHEIEGLS